MSDSDDYVRLAIENGDKELASLVNGELSAQPNRESNDIYQQLLQLRRRAKLSQQQLAAKLGMPQSSLARIEAGKGNPTLKTLQRIAAALDAELHMRSRS